MTKSETRTKRSTFAASIFCVGLALNIDVAITLFTDWNALAAWFPPLSTSFIQFHGLLLLASPGFYIAAVVTLLVWVLDGRRSSAHA